MSGHLPPGCTDRDVDVAAGGYDPPEPEQVFDRWEYRVISVAGFRGEAEDSLDRLGVHGWELVCVSSGIAYLKRPVFGVTK